MDIENVSFSSLFIVFPKVEFKEKWKNGTWYLDGVVKDDSIQINSAFVDDYGRRAIVFVTEYGNLVIFQSYPDRSDNLLSNGPDEFRFLFPSEVTPGEFVLFLEYLYDGFSVEELHAKCIKRNIRSKYFFITEEDKELLEQYAPQALEEYYGRKDRESA